MTRLLPIALLISTAQLSQADEPFALSEIATRGRTAAASVADFDGDGASDLLQIVFSGTPPDERRTIRLHRRVAGDDATTTDYELPRGAAGYDVADIRHTPGSELILLRQSDLLILSLRGAEAEEDSVAISGVGTIAPHDAERGIARMQLVHRNPNGEPWLVAQQLGSLHVVAAGGRVLGQLDIDGVATYYIFASPGLGFAESPLELHYTPARISIGRVDGDQRPDIVAATRHGVRVFLQRSDGTFASKADREHTLALVSPADHIRGSGGATALVRDIDGDLRADLLVSHVSGGISDASTVVAIHLNRGGNWNLEAPDQTLATSDRGSLTLLDLVGDERPELIQMTTPFSVLEIIEALTTRAIDADIAIYRPGEVAPFEKRPWATTKLGLPISFETFAPRGFLPSLDTDLNGDGQRDLVTSGSGDRLEVYLGGEQHRFAKRVARQEIGDSGALTSGDIDGDGRTDLVLYDPRRSDVPLKLLRNRGTLPGAASDPNH